MTCLNGNILWCLTTLLLTFTHELPRYHTLMIPIFSSKKPQDINLPYVSFSFILKKKNLTSSCACFGEDRIAQSPYGQTVIGYI